MLKRSLRRPKHILLESLEERTLFDAVPILDPALLELGNPEPAMCQFQEHDCAEVTSRTEVVFVDAGVREADKFLADLEANANGHHIEFQYLDSTTDGLKQIADFLDGRANIDAIHVVSHGNQAELLLGTARIAGSDLESVYADDLKRIGSALKNDGDVLLYGCDLASNEAGREFVNTFAELTAADVAASDDSTGHASLGGDWVLEEAIGQVDTDIRFSAEFAASYKAVLADPAVDIYVNQDDSATSVGVGESILYTIDYGNDGTQDASGVVLNESLPAGATFDDANSSFGWIENAPDGGIYEYFLGSVIAGTSGSVRFALTVNDSVSAGIDQIVGHVSIVDDGSHGADADPADNSAVDVDTLNAAPDLFVTKDGDAVVASAGDTVNYTIHYGNTGSQGATRVVLRETLPTDATVDLPNSSFGWIETAPDSGVYEFHLGGVSAGTSGTVSFAVTINESVSAGVDHIVSNSSIVDDGNNGADPTPGDNADEETIAITAAPDLSIDADDDGQTALAGDVITYTLHFSNDGTQDATGVVLREHLPDGTHFEADGSTASWIDVGSGEFELAVGTLTAGETQAATFAVTVNDAVVAGSILTNTVSIHDDGSNGPDLDATNNFFSVDTMTQSVEPPPNDVEPPADDVEPPPNDVEPPTDAVEPPPNDVEPPTDDVEPPPNDVEPPTDDVEPPPNDVEPPTDDVEPPPNDVEPPMDDVKPPTDDVEPPPNDVEPPSDDVEPPPGDVEPPTDDVVPPTDDVEPPPNDVEPPNDEEPLPDDEEPPTQLSHISGFVYVDTDGDGLFAAPEMPLSGIEVSLQGNDDTGNSVLLVRTTDATGGYLFDGVSAGIYTIVQVQPGQWQDGRETVSSANARVSADDEITVVVQSGESVPGNNFAEAGLSAKVISPRHFLASSSQQVNNAIPKPLNNSVSFGPPLSQSVVHVDSAQQSEQSDTMDFEGVDSTAKIGGLSERLSRWAGWLQRALNDDD